MKTLTIMSLLFCFSLTSHVPDAKAGWLKSNPLQRYTSKKKFVRKPTDPGSILAKIFLGPLGGLIHNAHNKYQNSTKSCSQFDFKCHRANRDLAYKDCLRNYGPFAVARCKSERRAEKARLKGFKDDINKRAAMIRLQQPSGPIRPTAGSMMLQRPERFSRRSGGGFRARGSRSMGVRAVDRSRGIARTASVLSNNRRGTKVYAGQGRAPVQRAVSAQQQRMLSRTSATAKGYGQVAGGQPRSVYSNPRSIRPGSRPFRGRKFAAKPKVRYAKGQAIKNNFQRPVNNNYQQQYRPQGRSISSAPQGFQRTLPEPAPYNQY
jgi:hypothetical protein